METSTNNQVTRKRRRSRIMAALAALCVLAAIAWGAWWMLVLRHHETTDDAYVAGNLVYVSSETAGSVEAIYADNTDLVKAGDVLVRLDTKDAELALQMARDALADTVRKTWSLMLERDSLRALVHQRKAELDMAEGDLERRVRRRTAMAVSEEEMLHAQDMVTIAKAALSVAKLRLNSLGVLLQDTTLDKQPQVLVKANELRQAWIGLERCAIKSPVDGYVAKRTVQVGARIAERAPLLAVVPLDQVWVDANFKEVQLGRMKTGQKATVVADMYGSSVAYTGTIAGFQPGTGSVFSLLPPENATGNWIKIVQRIPVRIDLDPKELADRPLFVGLSCAVSVNINEPGTHPEQSAPAKGAPPPPVYSTSVLKRDFSPVEEEIKSIIAVHSLGHEKATSGAQEQTNR